MTRHLNYVIFVLLTATLSIAQSTAVSGTIQDPAGQLYSNGTWFIQFHPNGFEPQIYQWNGSTFTQQYFGVLDDNGQFSITLPDNNFITPSGSQWDFQVCSAANVPCVTVTITVTGATQDVTTTINSQLSNLLVHLDPQPQAHPLVRAYSDVEIANPIFGALYYNLSDKCIHLYNGVQWSAICSNTSQAAFTCPTAITGSVGAFQNPSLLSCDNAFLTDFLGHTQAQSIQLLGPQNGEVALTTVGIPPPSALPTNTASIIPSNVIPTPFRTQWLPAPCTDGQVLGQASHTTDASGTLNILLNCINNGAISLTATSPIVVTPSPIIGTGVISCPTCGTSSGSVTSVGFTINGSSSSGPVSVTGSPITTSGTFNFITSFQGTDSKLLTSGTISGTASPLCTDANGGATTSGCPAAGAGHTQMATPSTPTATVNGTPASTDYKYAAVVCEDPTCSNVFAGHTPVSATVDVPTGAATLTSVNSITLKLAPDYGGSCVNWYRIASSGSPATLGLIAACADYWLTDTGLAGDSTTAPVNNTTDLAPDTVLSYNSPPGRQWGTVDSFPLVPTIWDDELNSKFGAPGDTNNPLLVWGNQGGATAVWTAGTIVFTPDTAGVFEYLTLAQALPSTPYTFETRVSLSAIGVTSASGNNCFIGFKESGTGKIETLEIAYNTAAGTVNNNGFLLAVKNSTSNTPGANLIFQSFYTNEGYLRLQNTGTNIVATFSPGGDGIGFNQVNSQAQTVPFTVTPNQFIFGASGPGGGTTKCTFSFERRTP